MRRRLTGPYSLRAAQIATAIALFFQWFIIVTGATVRLTGSGLGCPNWPTCTKTTALPELSFHPMVEFINRIASTPTSVSAIVAAWICWRLVGPARRDLRWATSLVIVGIGIQAVLGAFTVILHLPPEIVGAHYLVSILLLTVASFAWLAAKQAEPLRLARGRARSFIHVASGVMLVALLGVIVAGVLTTASGPHSGASGTGQIIDRFGFFGLAVTLHARGAYVFLVIAIALTWLRRATGRGPALRDFATLVMLVAAQIALGEIQYRSGLPWGIVLAHVVNAALLWIVASRIAIDAVFEPRGDAARPGAEPVLSGRGTSPDAVAAPASGAR